MHADRATAVSWESVALPLSHLDGQRPYGIISSNLPLDPAPGASFASGITHGENKCLPLPGLARLNEPNTSTR